MHPFKVVVLQVLGKNNEIKLEFIGKVMLTAVI